MGEKDLKTSVIVQQDSIILICFIFISRQTVVSTTSNNFPDIQIFRNPVSESVQLKLKCSFQA